MKKIASIVVALFCFYPLLTSAQVQTKGVQYDTQTVAPFASGRAGMWVKTADGLPYFHNSLNVDSTIFTLTSQAANLFLASPNGAPGVPGFRAILAADLPSLSGTYCALTGCTMVGNLLFSTDNTRDIGASGATRPRTMYFGTSLIGPRIDSTLGGTLTVGDTANTLILGQVASNLDVTIDLNGVVVFGYGNPRQITVATNSAGAGRGLSISTGAGGTNGAAGGDLTLTTALGNTATGATTGGAGGGVAISAKNGGTAASGTGGAGGTVSLTAGAGNTSTSGGGGAGGPTFITSGNGAAGSASGAAGAGGQIFGLGGNGGSGASGSGTGGGGGSAVFIGGNGGAAGGATFSNAAGGGGFARMDGGTGGAAGAGSGAAGAGGAGFYRGGSGGAASATGVSGAGGAVTLAGGAAGSAAANAASTAAGGAVAITGGAGAASATSSAGGAVNINGGAPVGAGAAGAINIGVTRGDVTIGANALTTTSTATVMRSNNLFEYVTLNNTSAQIQAGTSTSAAAYVNLDSGGDTTIKGTRGFMGALTSNVFKWTATFAEHLSPDGQSELYVDNGGWQLLAGGALNLRGFSTYTETRLPIQPNTDSSYTIGAANARFIAGYFGAAVGSQPACAAGTRGATMTVFATAGNSDTFQVCMKSAADSYAWKIVSTAP